MLDSSDVTGALADDKQSVTIKVGDQSLRLDAAEVEKAIWWLGQARSAMLPPSSDEPSFANMAKATEWRVPRFDLPNPCDVLLRTLHFGWVGLHLIPASRDALVATLTGADRSAPLVATKH